MQLSRFVTATKTCPTHNLLANSALLFAENVALIDSHLVPHW